MRAASPGRSIGNSSALTGQRAWGLASLVHSGPGVEPQRAMRARSRPTMSVSGVEPRPMRGWWPLRSWSFFLAMTLVAAVPRYLVPWRRSKSKRISHVCRTAPFAGRRPSTVAVHAARTLRSAVGEVVGFCSMARASAGKIRILYGDWVPWKRVRLWVGREYARGPTSGDSPERGGKSGGAWPGYRQ
jgi:hypothetical protein